MKTEPAVQEEPSGKGPVCGLQGCVCYWCNAARRAHLNPEAFKDHVIVPASKLRPDPKPL